MKQALFSILLVFQVFIAKADYKYISLSSLVCEADFGAIGTIVKVDKSYFYLKTEKYVLNKLKFDTLKIQKFESWSCGRRYEKYEVGQRELVFFRKSNYVIDEYELLGYGGGGEFELPIKGDSIYYNYSYGKLKPYLLNDFLDAVKDFNTLKQKAKETSITISKKEKDLFSSKSELHNQFIECRPRNYNEEYEVSRNSYISNLEKNHLYQDYENKVYVYGYDIDSIFLFVEDAEVWKTKSYFIVKPKDAWTRRFLNIYSISDQKRSKVLYHQIFEIIELPEPRIYFGSYFRDTVYGHYEAIPSAAHYLDNMHNDDYLKYELLSYNYIIKSGNSMDSFKIKSSRGTPEFNERLRRLEPGDKIIISDVYVLYPNQTVRQIKGRSVTVGGRE